ncbi:inositol-1-monophosphatase ImpA domain protein [Mycobacterium xenopi 3993]|nr:inositol-1-monophosphatase ImpA domain protein [Mycobacterium xenopi 3993]
MGDQFRRPCLGPRGRGSTGTGSRRIVTNLAGDPWTPDARSALAAAPGVHAEMLAILRRTGSPEDY